MTSQKENLQDLQTSSTEEKKDGDIEQRLMALEASSMGLFDVVRLVGVSILLSLILGAFGYHLAAKNNWLPASNNSKTVYLDFEKVMEVAVRHVAERGHMSIQGAHVDAQKFQQQISAVLAEYSQSGHIVINKRALIEGAPDADITSDVLIKLGLTGVKK